jgi:hypothetical protein
MSGISQAANEHENTDVATIAIHRQRPIAALCRFRRNVAV